MWESKSESNVFICVWIAEVTPSRYPNSVEETVDDTASLVQSIAAESLISEFTIVPSAILPDVTAPSLIFAVVTAES